MVDGGKTPIVSLADLAAMGFSLVLYANLPLRAAMAGILRALGHLARTGSSLGADELIVMAAERQEIVGLAHVEAIEREFLGRTDADRRGR